MLFRLPSRAVVISVVFMAIAPGCGGGSPTGPTTPSTPAVPPTPAVLLVTEISPNRGSTVTTAQVTIRGAGFVPGATVTLDVAATNVSVVNSTIITATVPPRAAGTVDVLVTIPGGQSARLTGAFTFGADQPYTVTPSQNTVARGGQLSVSWTAPRGGVSDWIGLFAVGDPNTNYEHHWWRYTDGAPSGTLSLTAPAQPGQYEFRYLLDDGYIDTGRSSPVTVR